MSQIIWHNISEEFLSPKAAPNSNLIASKIPNMYLFVTLPHLECSMHAYSMHLLNST